MSIQSPVNTATTRYQANSSSVAEAGKKPSASELVAANKSQQNQTILENQLSLSLQSDNKSMSLLYRAITDAVEKRLAEQTPAEDTEATTETSANKPYGNEDTSPQATADRIVSFATNFYQAFRERNPDLNDEDSMDQFLLHIGGGIDKGFADARDILSGLKKLEGKVASDIDETYSLIQQGLQDFKERTLQPKPEESAG